MVTFFTFSGTIVSSLATSRLIVITDRVCDITPLLPVTTLKSRERRGVKLFDDSVTACTAWSNIAGLYRTDYPMQPYYPNHLSRGYKE